MYVQICTLRRLFEYKKSIFELTSPYVRFQLFQNKIEASKHPTQQHGKEKAIKMTTCLQYLHHQYITQSI
jgi:hypothetical protein